MEKYFNITVSCNPQEHYMVNLDSRLAEIKKMIDKGQYFCINRGRQYGKTTTIMALEKYLEKDYIVIHLDFQVLDDIDFTDSSTFVRAFSRELWNEKSCRAFTLLLSEPKEKINISVSNSCRSTRYKKSPSENPS